MGLKLTFAKCRLQAFFVCVSIVLRNKYTCKH